MTITISGVDEQNGLALYGGDVSVYLSVLNAYVSYTPAIIDKLRNVSAETLPAYIFAIHTLKGTCASIGAEEARKTAIEMESIAKAGDLARLQAENDAFLKRMDTLVANIKSWLKQHDTCLESLINSP
ncbi:MAG: Hpt domain-containing protein [Spirochaetes bacterium]|nr:Hpt domain-containing protein [Spirochaetota bacterium]